MKLEKWALIAEVVGSFAVVVSLIVLIFEVRANTDLSRVAAYDAASRDFDATRRFYLSNPDTFELFMGFNQGKFPDPQSQPEEALKTQLFLLSSFAELERSYLAYRAGVFGDDEWTRVHRSECIQWGQIRGTAYMSPVSFRLTDGYVEHLDLTCTPEFVDELWKMYRGE